VVAGARIESAALGLRAQPEVLFVLRVYAGDRLRAGTSSCPRKGPDRHMAVLPRTAPRGPATPRALETRPVWALPAADPGGLDGHCESRPAAVARSRASTSTGRKSGAGVTRVDTAPSPTGSRATTSMTAELTTAASDRARGSVPERRSPALRAWSSGKARDFGSRIGGSNPPAPTTPKIPPIAAILILAPDFVICTPAAVR
jgi:hypothetical protein